VTINGDIESNRLNPENAGIRWNLVLAKVENSGLGRSLVGGATFLAELVGARRVVQTINRPINRFTFCLNNVRTIL
jgi:hypothetical protein